MKEVRRPRSYKITDTDYKLAMKRAGKEKVKFASMIEEIAIAYAEGASSISFVSKKSKNK